MHGRAENSPTSPPPDPSPTGRTGKSRAWCTSRAPRSVSARDTVREIERVSWIADVNQLTENLTRCTRSESGSVRNRLSLQRFNPTRELWLISTRDEFSLASLCLFSRQTLISIRQLWRSCVITAMRKYEVTRSIKNRTTKLWRKKKVWEREGGKTEKRDSNSIANNKIERVSS